MTPPNACDVSQRHHDALSRALLDSDKDAFAAHMAPPHTMTTAAGTQAIGSDEKMVGIFGMHSAKPASQGATTFIRIVKRAESLASDRIALEHESHVMRGAARLAPPYPLRTGLRQDDDRWPEIHATNGIAPMGWGCDTMNKALAAQCMADLAHDVAGGLA